MNSVVDSLVQKGVVSADAGTEIFRQGNIRAQIEMCIQEVRMISSILLFIDIDDEMH